VIEWVPAERLELLIVAVPVASRVAVAMDAPSTKNVTEPVGRPPFPATLAVKVIGESTAAGLGLAVTAVDVVAICTARESGEDPPPASFASPEYVATIK
jgi:hypothetical protein